MKFSSALFCLSLVALSVAQADPGLKDAVKGAPAQAPAPAKPKLPIPPKVNTNPKPPIRPAEANANQKAAPKPAAKPPAKPAPKPAAKPAPKPLPPMQACKFSCPPRDTAGLPLVKKPSAFGWDFDGYFSGALNGRAGGRGSDRKGQTRGKGWYDIFECVYNRPTAHMKEHTCSYYKHDGTHALGYSGDNCPPKALACPPSASASPPSIPALGLDGLKPGQDEVTTPLFSSSQLDGAELLDPIKGVYKYHDTMETPPWVEGGRDLVHLKEFPPARVD